MKCNKNKLLYRFMLADERWWKFSSLCHEKLFSRTCRDGVREKET